MSDQEAGFDPDFTEDDLAIVDRVWDRLNAPALTPARSDRNGRINLDGKATRTFVSGLVERLKARFGLTYRDKPDA